MVRKIERFFFNGYLWGLKFLIRIASIHQIV